MGARHGYDLKVFAVDDLARRREGDSRRGGVVAVKEIESVHAKRSTPPPAVSLGSATILLVAGVDAFGPYIAVEQTSS